ncbi:MAG TPA: L-threonylcarbamoyladenylate synthase [Polyangiaceae bacterium]|nr:L-threonylcarbamoyladenylate synthase [Polyangiaceae bacterium]
MARTDDSEAALNALAQGRVVAAATESFFGFLADARSAEALTRLLSLKPRGNEKGMPLLLPSREAFHAWVDVWPAAAEELANVFWPGPLTLALRARPEVDERLLLDGRIAARVAKPSPAADLVVRFGGALTATSANPPGMPPAVDSAQVAQAFAAKVESGDLYVLAGTAPGGAPSSVVVVEGEHVHVAREGAIASARIENALKRRLHA